jgi:hypothetical protein
VFSETVSYNIDKFHKEFDKNYSQLLARGAIVNSPISILFNFDAYLVVPYHNFNLYILRQHEDYLNCKLTAIMHKALMTSAKHKYDWLET